MFHEADAGNLLQQRQESTRRAGLGVGWGGVGPPPPTAGGLGTLCSWYVCYVGYVTTELI